MPSLKSHVSLLALSVGAIGIFWTSEALAGDQPAAPGASTTVSEVIVTGTRTSGLRAADSAAPVEVLGASVLKRVGQPDLISALTQNLPSFNASGYGQDTAALTVAAALRGLNPNETLVLVDGKRRNETANLAVDGGSPYSGAASADLSFIPVGAIDHVEVLEDGAAAQYGSDAIAGVVNIILKTSASGGALSATGGQYFEGDGNTGAWSLNKGISLGDKGFVNVTLEEQYHDFSHQGGADIRYSNPNGSLKSGLPSVEASGLPGAAGFPDVDRLYGDPQYNLYNLFYNAGYDLGDGITAYSFGSYGNRSDSAYETYRGPDKVQGTTSTGALVTPFPNGFDPREGIKEQEYAFTSGLKGQVLGWSWDLSSTYGKDVDQVYTLDSANAQLFPAQQALSATPITAQQNFYDGSYTATEWTSNLDLDRAFEVGLAKPLNVAVGVEQRQDTFGIGAGESASYYGAGAQSFSGYTPTDAGTHQRNSTGVYFDLATNPIAQLHVDLAGRWEHYSDFGDASVGKLTLRYDVNPAFAVRGTVSNGFRAPTLQEEYYSGTNISPTAAQVQLPADSAAARVAGFAPLKPEKSDNYSFGVVLHPAPKLSITADAYEIDIHDRIVGSGFLLGELLNGSTEQVISQAVLNAIAAHGSTIDSGVAYAGVQLFTNGADTRTRGVEATATYASDFGDFGHVSWSAGFNYNDTEVTKTYALPAVDVNAAEGQTSLLTPQSLSALTTGTPKEKLIFGAYWTLAKWSVNLRETVYGPSSELFSPSGSGAGPGAADVEIGATPITDLDIGYALTSRIKLSVGANNLLDIKPPTLPYVAGTLQPVNGRTTYGVPDPFSPFGINGGYYYGRVTLTF